MDLEGIMLSEISQIEKDKYHMISLIHRMLNTHTHTHTHTQTNSMIQRTDWQTGG